ncbi:hypothetical protein [Rhizobium sp. RAF56]|uniref:hypothetical protein n=1 Tax=Rhizobium sp. RAF56 TaxID=3233062 RepID=UPI003F9D7192
MWTGNHDGSEMAAIADDKIHLLIDGYGRAGGSEASRHAASSFVREVQSRGKWIFCSCREGAVLIPYENKFLHRRTQNSPSHDNNCPFWVEPHEQLDIVRSVRPHPPTWPFNFLRAFGEGGPKGVGGTSEIAKITTQTRRPKLARLLMGMIERSGMHRRGVKQQELGEQFDLLVDQASSFLLVEGVPVSQMLCRYASSFEDFASRFDTQASRLQWPEGVRPQATLLAVAAGVTDRKLVLRSGNPIPIRGRLSVYGRKDAPVNRYSSYLSIGVIAKSRPESEPALLDVYMHPCLSRRDMFLVGNNYERATFKVLRKLQLYYGNEIEIEIEKPVTDIGKKSFSRDAALVLEEIAKDGSQSILIPDFILRFPQFPPELRADIIVETMYFRGAAHRIEKTKSILMMKETLAYVKSVNHDFCFPDHISQKERDNAFIAEMRRAIERRLVIFGRGVGK